MELDSAKRRRVESALLSDDLWLLVWSFLTVRHAAMQRCVCWRFRMLLSSERKIPRTIERLHIDYEIHPSTLMFYSRYHVRAATMYAGFYLPEDTVDRQRVLAVARTFQTVEVDPAPRYNHVAATEFIEWLSSARFSLQHLHLPYNTLQGGRVLGFGDAKWQHLCAIDFRRLTTLELGMDEQLVDQNFYPMTRSPWIGSLTKLSLRVATQIVGDSGLERLFRACTSLTTLVLGLDNPAQWKLIATASQLQHVTMICNGHCSGKISLESLEPLLRLETLNVRTIDHRSCRPHGKDRFRLIVKWEDA